MVPISGMGCIVLQQYRTLMPEGYIIYYILDS